MKYKLREGAAGSWLKGKELQDGVRAKLVSETNPIESTFEGKVRTQDVAKIRIEGDENVYNISINRTTMNALVKAFGEDSKSWVNQYLTVKLDKTTIAGRRVVIVYLIPEGFELTEDAGGYVVITKIGGEKKEKVETIEYPEGEAESADQIPF